MHNFTVKKLDTGWNNPSLLEYFKNVPIGKEVIITISDKEAKAGQEPNVSYEKILQDIEHMETLCGTQIDYNDPNAVMYLLNDLSSWLSYSGTVKANAHGINAKMQLQEQIKMLDDSRFMSLGQMERKNILRGICEKTETLFVRADRVNASITHRCEHLRTFLSFHKQELALAGTQQG